MQKGLAVFLVLANLVMADEPPPVPATPRAEAARAPAAIKLNAVPRSGYALVTAEATAGQIKQAEFVVTASGAPGEVTFDVAGPTALVVTLPPSGTVTVWVVALMADGTLAQPVSTDLAASKQPTPPANGNMPPPTPTPNGSNPLVTEKNLRVTLAINLASPGKAEQDLLLYGSPTAQSLKQALGGLGHTLLVADVNSAVFQQALTKARQTTPSVPTAAQAPFLWVERPDRTFLAAVPLQLGADAARNAEAIVALFRAKP